MSTPSTPNPISVTASPLRLTEALQDFDSPSCLSDRINSATILLLPTDVGESEPALAFPDSTRDLLTHIERHLDSSIAIEALTADDDYQEYSYNSEIQILADILIIGIPLAQLVVPLLGSYVKDRLLRRYGTQTGGTVKSNLHVQVNPGRFFLLKYDGPADTFEKTVTKALSSIETTNGNNDDH